MTEAAHSAGQAAPVRWRRLPLRVQLLVVFLGLALGPLLLASAWAHLQARQLVAETALLNLRNVAALEAAQVSDASRDAVAAGRALVAGNDALLAGLRRADLDREPLRRHLLAKVGTGGFAELFVLDVQGRLLAGTSSPSSEAQRRCYLGGSPVEARLLGVERGAGGAELLHAAPIRSSSDELLGYLCARSQLELETALAVAGRERAMEAQIFLVARGGALLAGGSGEPRLAPPAPALDVRQGWAGSLRLGSGDTALAALAPVPALDAAVLAELPEEQALAGMGRVERLSLSVTALITALLIATVAVVARRLTRPVGALVRAAQHAAAGSLGERVSVEGPLELAELAHAFNKMTAALKASQGSLEQRVQERTRDLQASQDLSELLLNAIDQRVVVIGRDYRVLKANQGALKKYPTGLLGYTCHQLFEGSSRPCEDCPVSRAFATGKPQVDERTEGAGSLTEIVEVRAAPLLGRDGSVEAVVRLARVVTAEKQLQAQMMHREKMSAFGLLAAGVAHEIGNPLASIESQLRLAREAPEPGRVERTLEVVSKEVARISSLLRDLVTFARRPRNEQQLISLNQVVEDVARLLNHDPRARSVTVERNLATEMPGVRAKEDHLVQVLLNLGINALDAMPEGGTLEFSTCAEDDQAVVRVRDSGQGVPAHAQDHIFEPFFTTKDVGRGTGLGLFVSKSIVRDLKGHLALERTGPGGTTFCVRLPAARAGARP